MGFSPVQGFPTGVPKSSLPYKYITEINNDYEFHTNFTEKEKEAILAYEQIKLYIDAGEIE